jgi:hypothetical protein
VGYFSASAIPHQNKTNTPTVKAAKRNTDIKVVTFDWLEDSLQNSTHKREKPYLWKTIDKAKLKENNERRAKERKQAKHDGEPNPHHIQPFTPISILGHPRICSILWNHSASRLKSLLIKPKSSG